MEKISVSIRVRPLDRQEAAKGNPWDIAGNTIALCNASGVALAGQIFTFDSVFGAESTTSGIYNATTKDIVASAVKGFNGTVFAYGQTSSGKTYTMRGTPDELGIIPLAVHNVFKNLEEAVDREFLLRMSYMEIYNEEINDLLAPEQVKLQVHESLERGIFVAGLREEIVASPEQVLQLMEFGEAHRHIGETNMNTYSSRSHTIFRMVIESRDRSEDVSLGISCDAVRVSVLNLVDLAGSERLTKTGAEGARLKEGTHINKSLMTLGTVINKLSEGTATQGGHIPYRDSKLTRILQPALGGNARTAIICNITPAMVHSDESRGTLQFASRAIRVTNCVKVNEILTDAALLKRQKKEIEELRCKLQETHSEHLEDEILNLRNILLKIESEREKIALELEEEKKAHAERERQQAQKIENLSTLVLNSTVDDRDFEKRSKKSTRRETWCPRAPFQSILDEDFSRPAKEDTQILQNRERVFPLPPPFERLLEENEFNMKDSPHIPEDLTQGKNYDADHKSTPQAEACALSDRNAWIHVADKKRKFTPEIMTADQSIVDYLDESNGYEDLQQDFGAQIRENDGIHKGSLREELVLTKSRKCANALRWEDAEGSCKSLEICEPYESASKYLKVEMGNTHLQCDFERHFEHPSNKSFQQLLQEQLVERGEVLKYNFDVDATLIKLEQFEDFHTKLEILMGEAQESAMSLAQGLEEILKEIEILIEEKVDPRAKMGAASEEMSVTSEELKAMPPKVDLVHQEFEQMRQAFQSLQDANSTLDSSIADLKKEKEELALQLTEAYLQFEEEKAAWSVNEKRNISAQEAEKKLIMVDCTCLAEQVENHVLELETCKNTIIKLEKEVLIATSIAAEERRVRMEKSLEALTFQERMKELETCIAEETALRKLESGQLSELKKKPSSTELEYKNTIILQLEQEVSAAISAAEEERRISMEKSLEVACLKEKLKELETRLVEERDLRELESKKLTELKKQISPVECVEFLNKKIADLESDIFNASSVAEEERRLRELEIKEAHELKKKLSFVEDTFDKIKCDEKSFLEEKRLLLTQNLKFQVGIDALTAKAEVFYGRLQEARDEIEHLHRAVEDSKRVQELYEQMKKELSSAQNETKALKLELSSFRTSEGHQQDMQNRFQNKILSHKRVIHDHSLGHTREKEYAPVSALSGLCGMDQESSMNVTGGLDSKQHELWKHAHEPGEAFGFDKKLTFDHKLRKLQHTRSQETEENDLPVDFTSAPTVCLPARSTGLTREDSQGCNPSLSKQIRPILFPINGNKAVENKISNSICEVSLLPSVNKDSMNLTFAPRRLINLKESKSLESLERRLINLKQSKSLESLERSRIQPIKARNKESR